MGINKRSLTWVTSAGYQKATLSAFLKVKGYGSFIIRGIFSTHHFWLTSSHPRLFQLLALEFAREPAPGFRSYIHTDVSGVRALGLAFPQIALSLSLSQRSVCDLPGKSHLVASLHKASMFRDENNQADQTPLV